MEDSSIPPTVPLKVMSFNVAHGLGMDNKVDLEKTARVIEQAQPDIVGLQEVDRCFTARSSFCDQVSWFEKRLGMNAAFGPNLDLEPLDPAMPRRQYGNAILSKYPIQHTENHLMVNIDGPGAAGEQRGMLEAVIQVKGAFVHFFCTHLSLEEEELQVNVQQILEIAEKSRFPQILAGDFNAVPENRHIQRLSSRFHDVFSDLGKGDAFTYPTPVQTVSEKEDVKPMARIDYVFAGQEVQAERASVIKTDASDHLPIVAELVLKKPADNKGQGFKTEFGVVPTAVT
ncbi:endonuclease/exonuclease/phosphatase family protein [Planococcus sp. FY231025]|uniref:endonuclease/exonuclease/phosphatase family protein n=1 Tax=Planococcus sp. FY231025 TaxID=3455699 RepID=UPI003F8F51C5